MYAVFEYVVCILVVLVVGTVLFLVSLMTMLLQEASKLGTHVIHTAVHRLAQVIRASHTITVHSAKPSNAHPSN